MARRNKRTTSRKLSVKKESNKKENTFGVFVPAGLFIGMGIGFLLNQIVPWLFLGLGFGFLVMAIARMMKKR